MDLRTVLLRLSVEQGLDGAAHARLEALAGLQGEPAEAELRLLRGLAALAAALIGLGLVFWVAANWDTLGRGGRFALLQGGLLVALAGAWRLPAARAPLALLALLAIGALLAFFGQTYQTGADAWTLFALWALLALPLATGLRSDLLWTPWVLVVMTALALAVNAWGGHRWSVDAAAWPVHGAAWLLAGTLVVALGPSLRRYTGAGPWALRTAQVLALASITGTAIGALLGAPPAPQFAMALGGLVLAGLWFARSRAFDLFGLSAVALMLDTLLVAGLVRWWFADLRGDPVSALFFTGLAAAVLLAASVAGVMRLSRRASPAGEAA